MPADTNVVVIVGRLTRDPEIKQTQSGATLCNLRLAFTTRGKTGDQWEDRSNFVDVSVWGRQAESLGANLAKGRRVGVTGRLEWREWEKDGEKRQAVSVVADSVQYLDHREDSAPARPRGGDLPVEDLPF